MPQETPQRGASSILIMKCLVAGLPAVALPSIWPQHSHIAFGLGFGAGVLVQHFIPPRGKLRDLLVLLVIVLAATYYISRS